MRKQQQQQQQPVALCLQSKSSGKSSSKSFAGHLTRNYKPKMLLHFASFVEQDEPQPWLCSPSLAIRTSRRQFPCIHPDEKLHKIRRRSFHDILDDCRQAQAGLMELSVLFRCLSRGSLDVVVVVSGCTQTDSREPLSTTPWG